MNLTNLCTLGRSGLIVSPLALGTMTMGKEGWGSPDDASEAIFNAYVDAGGNHIDTADIYAAGRSEELLGDFIEKRGLRDRLALATKYSWSGDDNNPLAGGNGRKNLIRALEGSLKRLRTDYIDLYWMHVWDRITPAEEVLQAMGDLVRMGKIRYFALSDVPAWYAVRMATLAQVHSVPGPVALQMAYSLIERNIEWEYVPAALELSMGIVPWSPLGAGFLTGKYRREEAHREGRLSGPNPFGDALFTERNWKTLDTLRDVAGDVGKPLAQVALAWALAQPGVDTVILGARTIEQLADNLASLEITLPPGALATLNAASAPERILPYSIFSDEIMRGGVFGGADVKKRR